MVAVVVGGAVRGGVVVGGVVRGGAVVAGAGRVVGGTVVAVVTVVTGASGATGANVGRVTRAVVGAERTGATVLSSGGGWALVAGPATSSAAVVVGPVSEDASSGRPAMAARAPTRSRAARPAPASAGT